MPSKQVEKKEDSINISLLFSGTKARLLSVLTINLGVVGFFGITGYLLDSYFGTKPILLFVLIVLSFPVSVALIIKKAKSLVTNLSKNN